MGHIRWYKSLSLTVTGIFLFFIAVLLLYHIYFLLHFALQNNNCSNSTGVVKLVVVVDLWPLRRVHPLSARWPFKKIQLHSTNEHIYYKSAAYVWFFPSSQLLGRYIFFIGFSGVWSFWLTGVQAQAVVPGLISVHSTHLTEIFNCVCCRCLLDNFALNSWINHDITQGTRFSFFERNSSNLGSFTVWSFWYFWSFIILRNIPLFLVIWRIYFLVNLLF